MLPQLAARQDPRATVLDRLYEEQVDLPEVILRLGAHHQGQSGLSPFRSRSLSDRFGSYPHPSDVPGLLALGLERLRLELEVSASMADDVYLAALLTHVVLAVQPFEGGNGRVALDAAHHFLRVRWRAAGPVLGPSSERQVATLLGALGPGASEARREAKPTEGPKASEARREAKPTDRAIAASELLRIREHHARTFGGLDLAALRSSPPHIRLAHHFAARALVHPRGA